MTGPPPFERVAVAGQDLADAALVEPPDAVVARVEALDQSPVELVDGARGVQRAAALVRPGARDRGDAERGVHVRRAVALAREAVAEPEERALMPSDERRESLDLPDREPGDGARPCRRAVAEMGFERRGRVGKARHVVAVGQTIAEERVHHRAGERAVGPGLELQRQVRLPHRLGRIDVDRDDLGAMLFAGARRVGHQIDLGRGGVGAPDDDDLGLRHFRWRNAGHAPRSRDVAGPGDADADVAEKAGISLDVGQAVDAVAHHEAHRAGVEIGPDAFGAAFALGLQERLGDAVERLVPGDRDKLRRAFRADAPQGPREPVGVMDALGIARHFRAHDALGVGMVGGAMHAPDAVSADHLDVERAHRRAVVRADGGAARDVEWGVHPNSRAQACRSRAGRARGGRVCGGVRLSRSVRWPGGVTR